MSAKIRVLVIDDEAAIRRFLRPALEANNYEMVSVGTIAEGIKRIAAETPDVVLLDLGLPDGDGKDVIRRVREWSDLPIIVLSARDREVEKIEAFDLGANDYVNKPFNVGELLARMRAALRQRMQRKAEIPLVRVGNLEVDAVRHRATRAGGELKLTPKEFELLLFLAKHAGGYRSRRRYALSACLYRAAAAEGRRPSRRSTDHPDGAGNWISNRRKLSVSSRQPLPIATQLAELIPEMESPRGTDLYAAIMSASFES